MFPGMSSRRLCPAVAWRDVAGGRPNTKSSSDEGQEVRRELHESAYGWGIPEKIKRSMIKQLHKVRLCTFRSSGWCSVQAVMDCRDCIILIAMPLLSQACCRFPTPHSYMESTKSVWTVTKLGGVKTVIRSRAAVANWSAVGSLALSLPTTA